MKTLIEIRSSRSYLSIIERVKNGAKSRIITEETLEKARLGYFDGHYFGQQNEGEYGGLEKLCRCQAYYDLQKMGI